MSIDGKLDERAWTLPHAVSRLNFGSNNNSVTFGVLWDDIYLHVGVQVIDSSLQKDSTEVWFDDSVEIYLDGAGEGSETYDANDRQFTKGWNYESLYAHQSGAGVLHGVTNIPGGYTVEMAIPWANLGVVPRGNMRLGFDVQQNDDDNGGPRDGAMSWNAFSPDNYRSTADFGWLTLSPDVTIGTGGGGGTTGGGGGPTGGGGGTTGGGGPTGGGGGTTGGGGPTGGGGGTTGGGGGTTGGGAGTTWQPVAIRTAPQKAAGLPGGEGFQAIQYIAYSASNPAIAYMVNDMGAIMKSTDGGTTWQRKARGYRSISARYVAVHPRNENTVFVVSGYEQWETPTTNGIWRSTDGGDHWQLARQTFYNIGGDGMKRGNLLAFGENAIYAATAQEGILRSTDNGAAWTTYALSGQKISTVQVDPADPSVLVASSQTANALYRISNNGATVTIIGGGLPHYPNHFVIDRQNPLTMYAIAFRNGVYKSTNGGLNFTSLNSNFTPTANFASFGAAHIAISPVDSNYLYLSMDGYDYSEQSATLYYTHNGGASWHEPASMDEQIAGEWVSGSTYWQGRPSRESWHISPTAPHPTNRNIALGVGGFSSHIIKTTDGGANWRYSNSGNASGHVGTNTSWAHQTPFAWDRRDPKRFALLFNDYGGYMTFDGGDTYRYIGAPPHLNGQTRSYAGAIDPTPGSQTIVIGIGDASGQILTVSTDNGRNWTHKLDTQKTGRNNNALYQFIAFNPQSTNVVYADNRRSTDTGRTWSLISKTVAAMYPGDGNIVYCFQDQNVYKSTNAGIDWVSPYPQIPSTDIRFISIHPTDPNKIYLATGDRGLFIINGNTLSLKDSASGLLNGSARSVDVDPRNPNIVYVGIYAYGISAVQTVFRSTNGGNTFTDISGNLSALSVNTISVNPHDSYVYVSSYAGTWKLPPPTP